MNLLGNKKIEGKSGLTLDKLNRLIKNDIKGENISLSIFQSHNESKVVSYIQKNRNKFDGIIINPGPLQQSGYILKDLLDLIKVPYVTVRCKKEEVNLLSGIKNIYSENIYNGYIESIDYITKAIK